MEYLFFVGVTQLLYSLVQIMTFASHPCSSRTSVSKFDQFLFYGVIVFIFASSQRKLFYLKRRFKHGHPFPIDESSNKKN